MSYRSLFLVVCCAALIGAIAAIIGWLETIVSNAYLDYGMLRLIYQALVAMWNNSLLVSVVTAIALYTVSVLLMHKAGWSMRRVSRLAALAGTVIIMSVAVNWGLRIRTGFTLGLAARRIGAKIAGLATGTLSLTQVRTTFAANQEGAILLGGCLVAAALAVWLLLKIPWERVLSRIAANSRLFGTSGLVLALVTLSFNVIGAYDGWRTRPSGPNVLVIVVDCLRPDHMGYFGYARSTSPNMDELARDGMVFLNAYSNASWTKPSVGALFTSLYPNALATVSYVHILPAKGLTLAEVLRNEGYFTVFLNSENPFITERSGFHQGFDVAEDWGTDRDAAKLTDRFLSLLADCGDKKFFAYLHYMDAHMPYAENAMNAEFTDPDYRGEFQLDSLDLFTVRERTAEDLITGEDEAHIAGLYDGQIKYVDDHLGRIFSRLKTAGLKDQTLVVLLADHGEEFWDHGNFEHGHTVYQELIHVPLILSGCGLPSASVEMKVSLIDVMPTVLEVAGVNTDRMLLQGVSVGGSYPGEPGRDREIPVYAAGTLYGTERQCVITGDHKLIVNTTDDTLKMKLDGPKSTAPFEVYNLRVDPLEETDLSQVETDTVRDLKKLIKEFEEIPGITEVERIIIDEDLKKKLRAVGYL